MEPVSDRFHAHHGRSAQYFQKCSACDEERPGPLLCGAEQFSAPERQYVSFGHEASATETVKHAIESLGVPHTEVDLILVNGIPVPFSHPLLPGDQVSVYPVFESLDVREVQRLRPTPLRTLRFVLDRQLGELAVRLRVQGFDCWYQSHADDARLTQLSVEENRILLTRDADLLERSAVTRGYFVRHTDPARQLREVAERFDLSDLLELTGPSDAS
jgi:hypothetical protein